MRIEPRFLAVSFGLAAALVGQNDYSLDKVTPGTMGGLAALRVQGAPPNMVHVVGVSLNAGPTPISIIDPLDPRSLELGLELFSDWFFNLTSPTGTVTFGLTVPTNPVFNGVLAHWQTFTFPGVSTLVDQISNDAIMKIGLPAQPQVAPGALITGRAFAVSYLNTVANAGGGDVLLAGGGNGTLTAATGLASTEILDFRELSVHAGPPMASARALHLGIRLQDGRFLVSGGADAVGTVLSSCEVYDPATNTWSATGSMATPRVLHAGCRMADGRVMVAGGTNSFATPIAAITGTQNTAEIYNPATGTWSAAPNIGGNRLSPALSLLPNGRVMVSGGVQVTFLFGIPTAAGTTTAVQIYNPATNSWAAGAAMPTAKTGHHYNQVTLTNGRVLMTGGVSVTVNILAQTLTTAPLNAAEYYDQPTNTWTSVPMPTARSLHSATLLNDGRVIVCGGAQGTLDTPIPIANVEIFDPSTNLWTPQTPLLAPRTGHQGMLLPDGLLVLLGGQDGSQTTTTIECMHF
jgi:hypothetical protein